MDIANIKVGIDAPWDVNVIIEIPSGGVPVKYEVDKASGALFIDRFMATPMFYPVNYGFIPHTLSDDGDPVDALVISPLPLMPGVVARCRPIGVLNMEDESGMDEKILMVPVNKLTPYYASINSYEDISSLLRQQIVHFFEHYKDLEPDKWVKVLQWGSKEDAAQFINQGIERYRQDEKSSL